MFFSKIKKWRFFNSRKKTKLSPDKLYFNGRIFGIRKSEGSVEYYLSSDYSEDYLNREIGGLDEEFRNDYCDNIQNQEFRWGNDVGDDKIRQEGIDEDIKNEKNV